MLSFKDQVEPIKYIAYITERKHVYQTTPALLRKGPQHID